MKKLLLLLLIPLLFISCQKEELNFKTTYQVYNMMRPFSPWNLSSDGVASDIVVCFYKNNAIMKRDTISQLKPGTLSKVLEVDPTLTTISYSYTIITGTTGKPLEVNTSQIRDFIDKGKNNIIQIQDILLSDIK